MYDPQDDEVTREADAIGATQLAPTVTSGPGSGVVDAYAWSQEDGSVGAEPVPYVEDPYDPAPGTGRRSAASVPPPVPGRRHPARWPRYALGVGILVALIAIAGALYSLAGSSEQEAPVQPETSAVVVPPASSALPPPAPVVPPPAATTAAPPPVTTTEPPTTTTTAPPTTSTTTAPPSTTSAPPTTTTTVPTTTAAPSSTTAPPSTTVPPTTTTVPMTTEYLRIPLVPIPIPITVPEN